MNKFYLIDADFAKFVKGALIKFDNGQIISVEQADNGASFSGEVQKGWVEIRQECVSLLQSVDIKARGDDSFVNLLKHLLNYNTKVVPEAKPGTSSSSDMFYQCDPATVKLEETTPQLVKIKTKNTCTHKNIYGTKTHYYTDKDKIYANVKLHDKSVGTFSELHPGCAQECSVMVNDKYIKPVNNVIKKNSVFLDDEYITNVDDCPCARYNKDECIKLKNGNGKELWTVQSCHNINGQHCLRIKEGNAVNYIAEKDCGKRKTKYYEGVIIDPSSILSMEPATCDDLKLNDKVEVRLRDSDNKHECMVRWFGKVNGIKVVAVESATKINDATLQNLMSDGDITLNGTSKKYFNQKCYIATLSSIRKILPEDIISPARIKNINDSLKNSNITDNVLTELQFWRDNLSFFRPVDEECLTQAIKTFTIILKLFKRDFLESNWKSISNTENNLEKKNQIIIDCSSVALNFICDLCQKDFDAMNTFFSNKPLMEILEHIFDNLKKDHSSVETVKPIFKCVMDIFWTKVRHGHGMNDDWESKMVNIFQDKNADDQIKFLAALCISFLAKSPSIIMNDVAKYLTNFYSNHVSEKDFSRYSANYALMGLGKIRCLCITSNSDTICNSQITSIQSKDNESGDSEPGTFSVPEAELKCHSKLTSEVYEMCINKFVTHDDTVEALNYLVLNLAKLNDDKIFREFIKGQKDIEYSDSVVAAIGDNVESLTAYLGVIKDDHCYDKDLIKLASKLMMDRKNMANVELIMNRIKSDEQHDVDYEILSLAYTCLLCTEYGLFDSVLKKCRDVNSMMCDEETFLTYIINHNMPEEAILHAIEHGNFDLKK